MSTFNFWFMREAVGFNEGGRVDAFYFFLEDQQQDCSAFLVIQTSMKLPVLSPQVRIRVLLCGKSTSFTYVPSLGFSLPERRLGCIMVTVHQCLERLSSVIASSIPYKSSLVRSRLNGYSGINLIHGPTHRDTE